MDKYDRLFVPMVISLVMLFTGIWMIVQAYGQEIHHHPGMSQEIDEFYSRWRMPDPHTRGPDGTRVTGCCGRQDCHIAQVKIENGQVYGKTDYIDHWVPIPASKIESNYPDAVESPDGHNHMCHNESGIVYCFTFGIQI